jgi:hypothetical protein
MSPVVTVTTEPSVIPQVPSTTYYEQIAAEFMKALDQMSAVIPRIERRKRSPRSSSGRT